ncbi:Carbon-nitrogen hydrolase, partial [Trinorchestia longiramus]
INASEIVYTAAVLEFEAYRDWTDGGSEAIYKRNIHSFEFYATQAKLMGADIIVFPEYGLQGLDHNTRNDSVFQALTVPVPAPSARVAPCDFDNEDVFDPMQKLSCVARRLEMYLVVDLAEKAQALDQDGAVTAVYYNTQAVFDRNGFVVARYRKRHLYEEPNFEPSPDADDAALFTTDFGVAFSLQICFDIVFGEPSYANVQKNLTRDIITSTAWIDRAPFNMAPNVQNGFSRSLGVNLLIANYHWPELGKLGSGVYHGYSDLSHAYTYDEHSGNVLVVSPVRTVLSEPPQRFPHSVLSKPKILKYRRSGDAVRVHKIQDSYEKIMKSSDVLSRSPPHAQQRNQASVCFRDLCCSLSYYYFSSNELMYRLVAYNGYYPAGNRLLYVQVCGVLWCESTDINTCAILEPKPSTPSDFFGPFTLSGNFSSDVTFPSAMMRNFSLIPNKIYGFEEKQNGYSEIKFNVGTFNLAMAYIEGRKYSADIP